MNPVELTTMEIAERLGLSKNDAYGLVSVLEQKGLLRPTGAKKTEGKGRGAVIYHCDPSLPEKARELLAQLFRP